MAFQKRKLNAKINRTELNLKNEETLSTCQLKNDLNYKMRIILITDFNNNGYQKKMEAVSIENIGGRVGRILAKVSIWIQLNILIMSK